MTADLFLGIDIGSSAVKAVIFDSASAEVISTSRIDYMRISPSIGQLEIDLAELEHAVYKALHLIPADIKAGVQGVALAGQMCGLVCLDRHAQPLGRLISIFDTRAAAESMQIEQRYSEHLATHEANHALSIYTLPRILWLRQHDPQRFQQTWHFVLPKDYIRGVLTGEWQTEPSDASGTLAYDQFARTWDTTLLAELGLSPRLWPDIVPSESQAGRITPAAARLTGLPAGLPVFAGAADMAAVLPGTGATTQEDLVISLGTAAHVLVPVETLVRDIWPIQQYTQALPYAWYRFGAVFSGGASLEWFLRLTAPTATYDCFDSLCWHAPEQQVLFMPYLAGAGAPHYLPEAGGAFVGLKTGHSSRDLAQAVLEGVAFEILEVCKALDPAGSRQIYLTGGACRVQSFPRILAGVLGREVHVSHALEAPGTGAAVLAWRGYSGKTGRQQSSFEHFKAKSTLIAPEEQALEYYQRLVGRYQAAARLIRQLR